MQTVLPPTKGLSPNDVCAVIRPNHGAVVSDVLLPLRGHNYDVIVKEFGETAALDAETLKKTRFAVQKEAFLF
jgi:hypothetical protein